MRKYILRNSHIARQRQDDFIATDLDAGIETPTVLALALALALARYLGLDTATVPVHYVLQSRQV